MIIELESDKDVVRRPFYNLEFEASDVKKCYLACQTIYSLITLVMPQLDLVLGRGEDSKYSTSQPTSPNERRDVGRLRG